MTGAQGPAAACFTQHPHRYTAKRSIECAPLRSMQAASDIPGNAASSPACTTRLPVAADQ